MDIRKLYKKNFVSWDVKFYFFFFCFLFSNSISLFLSWEYWKEAGRENAEMIKYLFCDLLLPKKRQERLPVLKIIDFSQKNIHFYNLFLFDILSFFFCFIGKNHEKIWSFCFFFFKKMVRALIFLLFFFCLLFILKLFFLANTTRWLRHTG